MISLARSQVRIALLLLLIPLGVLCARAQDVSSVIEGRVSDSQQLALPQTVVELLNSQGQSIQKVVGDGSGHYQFAPVAPGSYTIQFSHSGFETAKKGPVTVSQNQGAILDAVLNPQQVVQNITVTATVDNDRLVASKTDVPLKDFPVTVQTVSLEVLQQQGATDIISAINNVPGANAFTQYGVYNYFAFRGFQVDKDPGSAVLLNGMRVEGNRVNSQINSIESVEVLKGPASMLYGTEATGGTINIVQKQPLLSPAYEVVLHGGRWGTGGVEFGATGPAGRDKLLYRLDTSFARSDGFRGAGYRQFNVTPALYWRLSSRDQFNFRGTYDVDRYDLDAGIPVLNPSGNIFLFPNVPFTNRYNAPGSFEKGNNPTIQTFYTHSFTEGVRVRQAFQYQYNDDEYWESEGLTVDLTPPAQADRENLYFHHFNRAVVSQTDFLADFDAIGRHQVLVGYEYDLLNHETKRSSAASNSSIPSISLYNPVETATALTSFPSSRYDRSRTQANAIYFQDYFQVIPKVHILASGRYDAYDRSSSRNPVVGGAVVPGAVESFTQNPFTYRVAINAQALPYLSFYSSYSTSFTAQTFLSSNGLPLQPETGSQIEIGSRLNFFNNRFTIDGSLYHIIQRNVAIFLANGDIIQAGQQYSKGAEVELRGRVNQRLSFFANYGFTQSAYDQFLSFGTDYSRNVPGLVPRHTARIWATYDFPKGFGVSLGGRYLSRRAADQSNLLFLGGFTTWDAAFHYRRAKMEYGVNIANILNKDNYFVSQITWNLYQLYPGPPINVSATVRYRF